MRYILLLILLYSCQKDPSDYINTYKIPKVLADQVVKTINDNSLPFIWEAPSDWLINYMGSSMRVASYLVPSSKGSGDLSVIYLNGDGGGDVANVNRWRQQLDLNILTAEEISLYSKTFSGKIGLYSVYEIINESSQESSFLCSIIPADKFTIFVKLNTHLDTIEELKKDFITFSSSFNYYE